MRLTERLARAEGYCCVYAFVVSWRELRIRPLARQIGYSERAILRLKARVEAGSVACPNRAFCQATCIKDYSLRRADSTSS